ncbi:MAG: hypothetical protein Q4D58_02855 [Synergistaceae bacterium]|nr:hypothetical protein [Synergistaceae bacterium]
MIDIEDFAAELVCGRDTLMLGGSRQKEGSFRRIVELWRDVRPERALVVFDYSGRLYERFDGEPLLADFSSGGSLIPDMIEPFVLNENIGSDSRNIAYSIRQAAYQEIKSRDANDKFFDDLGKLLTDRMFVYMLETEKNVLRNLASGLKGGGEAMLESAAARNLFTIFCRQHQYVESLMTKAIGGESGALPVRQRLIEAEARSPFLTREEALAAYILRHELRFQKNGDRDAPVPFADLLFTNSDNTNTQRCIKMQADASTADFRALVSLVVNNAASLCSLPTLKLGGYLAAPQGRPLFVCSSGSSSVDRGFAPLLIAALGAAAQNEKHGAVILIPELDRWGLINYLDKFRQSWRRLSFTFGYDNFSRLSLDSRAEEGQLIESLYSSSSRRIWHATKEERLNKAFASYVSEADVIYRPDDLDEDIRAVEEEGHVRYVSLEERPAGKPLRGRVRLSREGGASSLWLTKGAARREKLTLESLLEDGDRL